MTSLHTFRHYWNNFGQVFLTSLGLVFTFLGFLWGLKELLHVMLGPVFDIWHLTLLTAVTLFNPKSLALFHFVDWARAICEVLFSGRVQDWNHGPPRVCSLAWLVFLRWCPQTAPSCLTVVLFTQLSWPRWWSVKHVSPKVFLLRS